MWVLQHASVLLYLHLMQELTQKMMEHSRMEHATSNGMQHTQHTHTHTHQGRQKHGGWGGLGCPTIRENTD